MSIDYEVDPRKIEAESFRLIRELTPLDSFDREQQQVAIAPRAGVRLAGHARSRCR